MLGFGHGSGSGLIMYEMVRGVRVRDRVDHVVLGTGFTVKVGGVGVRVDV